MPALPRLLPALLIALAILALLAGTARADTQPAGDAHAEPDEDARAEPDEGQDREPSTDAPMRPAGQPQLPRPQILVQGGGWGHGVGMSQYGAHAQALDGRGYRDILSHYYQGVDFETRPMPGHFRVGLRSSASSFDFSDMPVHAVGGSVDWERCGPQGCTLIRRQPGGTTWTATRLPDRRLRVEAEGGSQPVYTEASSGEVEYLRVRHHGTEIELPRRAQRRYKWGDLHIRPSTGDRPQVRAGIHFTPGRFELYLRGIAEVPHSWHGQALRAQVLAARTYAAQRTTLSSACECHVSDSADNQVYAGYEREREPAGARWVQAVSDTAGEVITHGGKLISAFYSSSHNGRSEDAYDSWAYCGWQSRASCEASYPYLRSVDDPWSAGGGNPYASWQTTLPNAAFASRVADDLAVVTSVGVLDRTRGGTPVAMRVQGRDQAGAKVEHTFTGTLGGNAGGDLRMGFSSPTVRSAQIDRIGLAPFVDDLGGNHELAAVVLHDLGITQGCQDDAFCPHDSIRRDHMARFLKQAKALPPADTHPFTDIDGSAFEADIAAIRSAGITSGCKDGSAYCPLDTVERRHMASFLVDAFDLPPAPDQGFSDIAQAAGHADDVNALRAAGVTVGCRGGSSFCPRDPVTRGEMATFLARALGYDL